MKQKQPFRPSFNPWRFVGLTSAALALLALVSALGACGSAPAASTPTPTRTLIPTLAPTSSPTAVPPTPTASPTPAAPTPRPENVNPLTGLVVSDAALLRRLPVAIKVSNTDARVRPQAGLNRADLVFEHYAEGGNTRFTAVFLAHDVDRVGSVRSGRLIDLEIPAMYGAVFACSGFSAGVLQRMADSDLYPDYIASPSFGVGTPTFYRIERDGMRYEDTMFTSPVLLREWAAGNGVSEGRPLEGMVFDPLPAPGGVSVTHLLIPYRATTAEWAYDAAQAHWLRTTDGEVHADALDGQQLHFANVVALYARHVETDILEDTWGGGHWSIEIQLWDSGPCRVFRDGRMYEGTWQRAEREDMVACTFDAQGQQPIPLKPGNTFFELVTLDAANEWVGEGEYEIIP